MTDTPPDRLSTDPRSPYFNAEVLRARRRHPLQGRREDQRRGILRQRGLDPRRRRQGLDRYGNPLTIKLTGAVEPYFKDKTEG